MKKKDKSFVEWALTLINCGWDDVEVSDKMGKQVSKTWVFNLRRSRGIPANYSQSLLPTVTKNGLVVCKACNIPKPRSSYSLDSHATLGIFYSCKECCMKKRAYKESTDIRSYASRRLTDLRRRLKEIGESTDLTVDWVVDEYFHHNGKCFYTDETMSHARGKGIDKNALSFDRVRHDGKYVTTNVVLCTRRANVIKSDLTEEEMRKWLPDWHARLTKNGYF